MTIRTVQRRLSSLTLPLIAGACTALAPHEVELPAGAVAMTAPAAYQEWYQKTEQCSGLAGTFSTVQWYVVPGVETFPTADGSKVGEWMTDGTTNRIIIAGNYQNHEMVVSHELLHSLLRQSGHPDEYFVRRCQLTWDSWNSAHGTVGGGL